MRNDLNNLKEIFIGEYNTKSNKLKKLLQDTFNINYFSYQRVEENGNYLVYISDQDYLDYFIDKSIYQYDAMLISPHNYYPGNSLHTFDADFHNIELPIINKLPEIQHLFSFNQSVILKRNFQNYYETYIFSISNRSKQALDALISQLHLLEKFIKYFHREYNEELNRLRETDINIEKIIGKKFHRLSPFESPIEANKVTQFLEKVNSTEWQLRKSIELLTPREKECLYWLIQGKTAQETADILSVSKRTIEFFRENCRIKFGGHYTFSNLIYLLGRYKLF